MEKVLTRFSFNKIAISYTSEESLINVDSFLCKDQLNKVHVSDHGRYNQQIIVRLKTEQLCKAGCTAVRIYIFCMTNISSGTAERLQGFK